MPQNVETTKTPETVNTDSKSTKFSEWRKENDPNNKFANLLDAMMETMSVEQLDKWADIHNGVTADEVFNDIKDYDEDGQIGSVFAVGVRFKIVGTCSIKVGKGEDAFDIKGYTLALQGGSYVNVGCGNFNSKPKEGQTIATETNPSKPCYYTPCTSTYKKGQWYEIEECKYFLGATKYGDEYPVKASIKLKAITLK